MAQNDQQNSGSTNLNSGKAERPETNTPQQTKTAPKPPTTVVYTDSKSDTPEVNQGSTPPRATSAPAAEPVFHDINEQLTATLDGLRFNADLIKALNDAVIACDKDFVIQTLNPAAERLFGIKRKNYVGLRLEDLLKVTMVNPRELRAIGEAFTEQRFWHGRVRQFGGKKQVLYTECTATPLYDKKDKADGLVIIARDVSPLIRAERLAEEQTKFATSVLESLPGRTCILDSAGVVIASNKHYRDQGPTGAGENTGPQVGADYRAWANSEIGEDASGEVSKIVAGVSDQTFRDEFATVRRRRRNWTEIVVVPLSTESGGAVVTHLDITGRKQAETTLKRRATHDPLTGLPNRVLLTDRLSQALARASRSGQNVGIMFCDLDGFRDINNKHGHLAGDKLLVTIAKRLRAVCRSTDTVARVSGDEFVIVLEDVQNESEIEEVSKRVIDALSEPVNLDEATVETGTSIGLIMSPGVSRAGVRTIENVIRDADSAMYAAKESGRGTFAWFSPEMRERQPERPALVKAIGKLIGRS